MIYEKIRINSKQVKKGAEIDQQNLQQIQSGSLKETHKTDKAMAELIEEKLENSSINQSVGTHAI